MEPSTSGEANYKGSSPAMESHGALNIWKRSVELYKLRYTSMISDGDSSTFKQLHDSKPYGASHPVTEHECIDHELRVKCKEKLVDGKGKQVRMKEKGRLTDKNIKKLTKYYGKAIRSNIGDSAAMKDAIWAIFYHSQSTDSMPQHQFCPSGQRSWCKYNRAFAMSEPPPSHSPTIHPSRHCPSSVQDLCCKDSLMEGCVLQGQPDGGMCAARTAWWRDVCCKDSLVDGCVLQGQPGGGMCAARTA